MHRIENVRSCTLYACMMTILFHAFIPTALAEDSPPKRILKGNNTEIYNTLPKKAATFADIFKQGMFFGRLRMNSFYYENKESGLHDPRGFGLGGSLIYKTAPFYGVGATAGLYTSQNFGLLDKEDALYGRSGKDTFSRYDRLAHGDWGMTVLAQAYLQYSLGKSEIKFGRQNFESFITASNDTKMIPNTFEGVTLCSNDIPGTTVILGYLTAEKNRDHTTFHDVMTYDDGKGNPYSKYNNQDDSVAHKGLSYSNLKAAGEDTDNELVVAGITNKSIRDLILDLGLAWVPDLFHTGMVEAGYQIPLGNGFTLTPAFRYMQQFDDGAGDVGGAALSGTLVNGGAIGNGGYDDPDSVDARLYAARFVLQKGAGKFSVGYSKVSDDADFIAPWRGFPTSGYTRSMGQYNWFADTESFMVLFFYDFGKAGMVQGFRANVDFTYTNYDDKKERMNGISATDLRYFHFDFWYGFPFLPDLEAKLRVGFGDADDLADGTDPSFMDWRFELNYLF